jgi:hypothetical protein
VSKSIIVSMATSFDVTAGESLGKNGQRAALRVVWVYIEKSNMLGMAWRAGGRFYVAHEDALLRRRVA